MHALINAESPSNQCSLSESDELIESVRLTVSLSPAWDPGDQDCLGLARAHRLLSLVVVGEVQEEVSVAAVAPTINNSYKVVVELATTNTDKVLRLNLAEQQCHSSGSLLALLPGIWAMVRLTENCSHHTTMVAVEVDVGQARPP
ncbi:hypothetical protein U9M48_026102 [Paspalum notatum var. saurae]|uniref:Uncharacterized protein n=1 Tax=Paspalum notatum var. saurae TaxID=547442 RepID=A0AAQ3WZ04_PASNO